MRPVPDGAGQPGWVLVGEQGFGGGRTRGSGTDMASAEETLFKSGVLPLMTSPRFGNTAGALLVVSCPPVPCSLEGHGHPRTWDGGEDAEHMATAETWAAIKTGRHNPSLRTHRDKRDHTRHQTRRPSSSGSLLLRVPPPRGPSARPAFRTVLEPLARRVAAFLCTCTVAGCLLCRGQGRPPGRRDVPPPLLRALCSAPARLLLTAVRLCLKSLTPGTCIHDKALPGAASRCSEPAPPSRPSGVHCGRRRWRRNEVFVCAHVRRCLPSARGERSRQPFPVFIVLSLSLLDGVNLSRAENTELECHY